MKIYNIPKTTIMEKMYFLYLILSLCLANSYIMRLFSLALLAVMFTVRCVSALMQSNFKVDKVTVGYFIFVSFALLSCIWCTSIVRASVIMYEFITSLLFIIITAGNIYDKKSLNRQLNMFVIAVLIMCLVLLFNIDKIGNQEIRAYGSQIIGLDKNYFSQITVFATIIVVFLGYTSTKKIYFLFVPVYLMVIIDSGSRKALLSMVLGLSIMFLYAYRNNLKKLLNVILVGILILGLGIGLFAYINPEFVNKIIVGLVTFFNSDLQMGDASAIIRVKLIERGMELFRSSPLFGVGVNNFSFYSGDINVYGGYMYAHNNYIEILSDLGIIGICIYYMIYITFFKQLIKVNKKHELHWFSALAFSLIVLNLINDVASVSYYLKYYIVIILYAHKMITLKEENHDDEKTYILDR